MCLQWGGGGRRRGGAGKEGGRMFIRTLSRQRKKSYKMEEHRQLGVAEEVINTRNSPEPEQSQVGKCGKSLAGPLSHIWAHVWGCTHQPPSHLSGLCPVLQFSWTGAEAIVVGKLPLFQSVNLVFLYTAMLLLAFLAQARHSLYFYFIFHPCLEGPPR